MIRGRIWNVTERHTYWQHQTHHSQLSLLTSYSSMAFYMRKSTEQLALSWFVALLPRLLPLAAFSFSWIITYFHCKVHDTTGNVAEKNVRHGKVIEELLAMKKGTSQTSTGKRISRENYQTADICLIYCYQINILFWLEVARKPTQPLREVPLWLLFSKEQRQSMKTPQIISTS